MYGIDKKEALTDQNSSSGPKQGNLKSILIFVKFMIIHFFSDETLQALTYMTGLCFTFVLLFNVPTLPKKILTTYVSSL